MKISHLITDQGMKDIILQAEVNAMAKFDDELWSTLSKRLLPLFRLFDVTPERAQLLTTMLHDISESVFKVGAIIGSHQAVLVLMETIKRSEPE